MPSRRVSDPPGDNVTQIAESATERTEMIFVVTAIIFAIVVGITIFSYHPQDRDIVTVSGDWGTCIINTTTKESVCKWSE